jgi:hypothetical protein
MKYLVAVLEGTNSDDVAHYYCTERPRYSSEPVGRGDEQIHFVNFIPKNGSPWRVNKVNAVPMARVIAIVEEPEK